jgi:dCMP deaminase
MEPMDLADLMNELDWDFFYTRMARFVATKSKDERTKCGCVLVGPNKEVRSIGYNGLPRKIKYTEKRNQRPNKYFYYEHAERNAIYNAIRIGVTLEGCTAYITGTPCADCARGLIQTGVTRVVVPNEHQFKDEERQKVWKTNMEAAREMLEEAGVVMDLVYCEPTQTLI